MHERTHIKINLKKRKKVRVTRVTYFCRVPSTNWWMERVVMPNTSCGIPPRSRDFPVVKAGKSRV